MNECKTCKKKYLGIFIAECDNCAWIRVDKEWDEINKRKTIDFVNSKYLQELNDFLQGEEK